MSHQSRPHPPPFSSPPLDLNVKRTPKSHLRHFNLFRIGVNSNDTEASCEAVRRGEVQARVANKLSGGTFILWTFSRSFLSTETILSLVGWIERQTLAGWMNGAFVAGTTGWLNGKEWRSVKRNSCHDLKWNDYRWLPFGNLRISHINFPKWMRAVQSDLCDDVDDEDVPRTTYYGENSSIWWWIVGWHEAFVACFTTR